MQVIPVIDLMAGHVVHARAGERNDYQPVRSLLHPGSDPCSLAQVFRDLLLHPHIYVADLDAIGGRPGHYRVIEQIAREGGRVHIDPGVRSLADVQNWLGRGASRIILGSETLSGPNVLRQAVQNFGSEKVALGLDLRNGRPLLAPGSETVWGLAGDSALGMVRLAEDAGMQETVVLELKSVGVQSGLAGWAVPLAKLCQQELLRQRFWVGGGLAEEDELAELANAGISGALLATALHQNKISRRSLGF